MRSSIGIASIVSLMTATWIGYALFFLYLYDYPTGFLSEPFLPELYVSLELYVSKHSSFQNALESPISAFEIKALFVSSSLNPSRTGRQYHVSLNLKHSASLSSGSTHCDLTWDTVDDPPESLCVCLDPSFAIGVSNFEGLKTFDLSLRHSWSWYVDGAAWHYPFTETAAKYTAGRSCGDPCCKTESPGESHGGVAHASVSVTPTYPGWKDARRTSGGTYYAVANDTIVVDSYTDVENAEDYGDTQEKEWLRNVHIIENSIHEPLRTCPTGSIFKYFTYLYQHDGCKL
ncbi:hypothetical protein LTS08_000674 [Lithohypha guttulata]|nr:hypothetical protein LTS08_000674 [Lithohypha guttulata]